MSSLRSRSGGMCDADDVQPVVQILPKRARRDLWIEFAVRRGDDADVDPRAHAIGADALDLAGLEKPEQRRLHAQAHLADLVEKHRAVGGGLENPRLVPIRAGEAAPDMAEQLGLHQRIRHAGAVQRRQRCRRPSAPLMDERATTSLPTPVSPVISTLASERAARSISSWMARTALLAPMKLFTVVCPLLCPWRSLIFSG